MIECTCLCGAVRFTHDGALHSARYCHCTNCRKFSGTSPAAWALGHTHLLTFDGSPDLIEFDSGLGIRCSCSRCGSPVLFKSKDHADLVALPLGIIDTDTNDIPTPEFHLWVGSKPAWCIIGDDLPLHKEGPDSEIANNA